MQFFLKRIGQADFNQLTLETSAGITRSVGFADFILKPAGEQEKTYGIGIQIQGYQYRYLVENKNGDATPLAKQLFEAGNLMGCTTHPHPKIGERLRFNQFGANFKYRYRNIGPSATTDTQTPHSLATQILEDLSRIAANAMQQIAIAEKAGSAQ